MNKNELEFSSDTVRWGPNNTTSILIYIDVLMQDCSNPSVLAMELLQSCTKPLIQWLGIN